MLNGEIYRTTNGFDLKQIITIQNGLVVFRFDIDCKQLRRSIWLTEPAITTYIELLASIKRFARK